MLGDYRVGRGNGWIFILVYDGLTPSCHFILNASLDYLLNLIDTVWRLISRHAVVALFIIIGVTLAKISPSLLGNCSFMPLCTILCELSSFNNVVISQANKEGIGEVFTPFSYNGLILFQVQKSDSMDEGGFHWTLIYASSNFTSRMATAPYVVHMWVSRLSGDTVA